MLLNVLGASDGESILVLVVEEDRERGRVYGGSQAGDVHVSLDGWDRGRGEVRVDPAARLLPPVQALEASEMSRRQELKPGAWVGRLRGSS